MKLGLPVREHTALLVIDVQERLMPVIFEGEKIFTNVNSAIIDIKPMANPMQFRMSTR